MSKKFNFKDYQKTNGNEHINMRLEKSHKEAPDVINEKQLDSYRSVEEDVTIEKLLEKNRTGEETEVTERRLDTHKSKFANKYRNPSAHEGDINKLEEKRLLDDPSENEKYEQASKAPSQFRWWEDVKSPDGLKLAKKTIVAKKGQDEFDEPETKVEEMSFDKPRWQEATEPIEETFEKEPQVINDVSDDFDIYDEKGYAEMNIVKEKYQPNQQDPDISSIYILLSFDSDAFKGDEEAIKQAALDKVLVTKPELSGLISTDDFGNIKEGVEGGMVSLRAVGEQFADIKQTNVAPSAIPQQKIDLSKEPEPIEEISYEEKDEYGTPMAIGTVSINEPVTEENRDKIIDEVVGFVKSKHPHIQVEPESLDITDIERGEVRYMVGVMGPELESLSAGSDFEIIVQASSKKN